MDAAHIPPVEDSPYPLRSGNRVQPLIGGERAFRRILESIDTARHSVWVTVAFLEQSFRFPDKRGDLFAELHRAAARGLDVRALFWRSPAAFEFEPGGHFLGTEEDHAALAELGAHFSARWDELDKTYCHHQKSWLIDAGHPGEVAFVGGINLNNGSVTSHPFADPDVDHTQDIYCELAGPVATDVHHNFVQRWNGASARNEALGAWPGPKQVDDLPFPEKLSARIGDVPVQLSRTVRGGFYDDATAPPGGFARSLSGGESGVLQQYLAAINAAQSAIYIENQTFMQHDIFSAIEMALARGVRVVVLVPGIPSPMVQTSRSAPGGAALFARLGALGDHSGFTLAGLAANRPDGHHDDVYVHTKAAIIDDSWATIGSTNIANRSFFSDTELNVSFWHRETVLAFQTELLSAHHGSDLSSHALASALDIMVSRAQENRIRRTNGQPLEGHVFEIDPLHWGESTK